MLSNRATRSGRVRRAKAYVVRTPGSDLAPKSLMEFTAAAVAPHQKIPLVEIIDQVPR